MATVKDTAQSLRETLPIADALRRFAPNVQLHKNGAELCGPCPRCGGDDRFYVTQDNRCACRQCHTQRMDVAGMTAWLLGVTQHEAVEILQGRTPVTLPFSPTHPGVGGTTPPSRFRTGTEPAGAKVGEGTETRTQPATWRTEAAQRVRDAHKRLFGDTENAGAARAYLTKRGLSPDTWRNFLIGYDRARVPGTDDWRPAVCWPVTHEESGETVAVKYRFFSETHAGKRYTSLPGSQLRERLFGTALLWADVVAKWRCLVITEGEFNAMSVHQSCNDSGVDVLSFGSESQRTLPAWAIDLASRYGAVVTWLDDADKAREVSRQLPNAVTLRSFHSELGVKQDANELLKSGKLGGLVQTARLRATPAEQHEAVLWDLWDAAKDNLLDAGQVKVGRQLAQTLGYSASWPVA